MRSACVLLMEPYTDLIALFLWLFRWPPPVPRFSPATDTSPPSLRASAMTTANNNRGDGGPATARMSLPPPPLLSIHRPDPLAHAQHQ